MKWYKKLSTLVVLLTMTTNNVFSVCADTLNSSMLIENNSGPNGDSMGDAGKLPTKEEQINQAEMILKSRTANNIEKKLAEQAIMKLNLEEPLSPTLKPTTVYDSRTRGSYTAYILGVPLHKQETSYYCGPATTLQTLEWHGAWGHTQSSLANSLGTNKNGTDGLNIIKVLNNNQNKTNYIVSPLYTQQSMMNYLYSSIASLQSPAVLRLFIKKGGNWRYDSLGHFMNASGISTDKSLVYVTDPYIQHVDPNITGNFSYAVTANEVYTATYDHFARHFYW